MATSSTFSTSNQYIKYRIVVTESNVSIANNTSTINVKVDAWRTNTGYTTSGTGTCYCTVAGTKYSQSISASQEIKHNSHTVLLNKTINNFAHNADGSKSIYVQAKIDHQRFDSSYHGFTVNLTKIPRQANIMLGMGFSDEGTPAFMYENPAGDVVESLRACISLSDDVQNPIVAFRDVEKSLTSGSFAFDDLTTAERNALRASTPNSNELSVVYILETVIAGVTYYSTTSAVMNIVNANPVATGITYQDVNSATTAITLNNQQIIQNKSSLRIDFASITALKYADLVSVSVTINSITQTKPLSSSSALLVEFPFGVIDSSSNQTAQIVITDSRGNTASYSLNITMLEWKTPSAIVRATRTANYYSETTVFADATFSSLDGKNTITILWEYKEKSASTYTAGGSLADGGSAIVSLDNEKAWDVRFNISDRLASVSYNVGVEIGIPIVFFDKDKRSMSINKFPSNSSSLEIKGNTYHDGDILFNESGTNLRQLKGNVGGSDEFRLAGGATASDAGFAELATAGDGDEPIFARQYDEDFANVVNEIELLDANGATNLNDLNVSGNAVVNGNIQANGVKLPHAYSTTEQLIGFWIDGSPIYERVIELSSDVSISANTWSSGITISTENINVIKVDALYFASPENVIDHWGFLASQTNPTDHTQIRLYNSRNSSCLVNALIIQYFKESASS